MVAEMITIFSCPKAMVGYIGTIQKNAILSWKKNIPDCNIILFGNEEGVADFSREWNIRNVDVVGTNEFGTPMLDSMFNRVQTISPSDYFCYVNSDIIICGGFLETLDLVSSKFDRFLIVGRRYDVDPGNYKHTVNLLETLVKPGEIMQLPVGSWFQIDYFIYKKGDFLDFPPFAIGRPVWDNWMIKHARKDMHIPVIDASSTIVAVHQKHDYNHVPQARGNSWDGPEGDRNRDLAGGDPFCILNANFISDGDALRRAYIQNSRYYLWIFRCRLSRLLYHMKRIIP